MEKVRVVTAVERRRRFTKDEKSRILEELREPDTTIIGTAKRHGISPSLLHLWKKNALAASEFVPVVMPATPALIRISMGDDISIDFPANTDLKVVARFLKELRT